MFLDIKELELHPVDFTEGLQPDVLTLERVERFLSERRAAGYSTWLSARSLASRRSYGWSIPECVWSCRRT